MYYRGTIVQLCVSEIDNEKEVQKENSGTNRKSAKVSSLGGEVKALEMSWYLLPSRTSVTFIAFVALFCSTSAGTCSVCMFGRMLVFDECALTKSSEQD